MLNSQERRQERPCYMFTHNRRPKNEPAGALRLRRTASSRTGALHRWQQGHQFRIESVRHVPAGASQNTHAYNKNPDNNTLNIIPAICRTPTSYVARGCGFWFLCACVGMHTLNGTLAGCVRTCAWACAWVCTVCTNVPALAGLVRWKLTK